MDPGDRGWSELKSCHCTPAWATRAKLHLKKESERMREREEREREERKEEREGGREPIKSFLLESLNVNLKKASHAEEAEAKPCRDKAASKPLGRGRLWEEKAWRRSGFVALWWNLNIRGSWHGAAVIPNDSSTTSC